MSYQADPSKIFGRDKKINHIWSLLGQGKSIRFTAERRIGKTSIMQKMRAEPKDNYIPILIDLEQVYSPDRFVEVVAQEFNAHQGIARRITNFIKRHVSESSLAIQGLKLSLTSSQDWRTTLDDLFANLCLHADNSIVLLLLDEIPYMLQNIYDHDKAEGEKKALEILDSLRAIRHKYPNIRMIFTGSVGLHHVLKTLKSKGSLSQPLNDLELISIESLQINDALECIQYFCNNIELKITLEQMGRIAKLCNGVPFYMDKVINKLGLLEREGGISDEDIEETFSELLSSEFDEWQMKHFIDRLYVYYEGQYEDSNKYSHSRAELAGLILDFFAQTQSSLTVNDVYNHIIKEIPLDNQIVIKEILSDLVQDHYLVSNLNRDSQKIYSFTYTLIQRWWCIQRGLILPQELI
ncbi:hypothetical protein [Acinetobacter seifertii]|uniref:hypothetical protein n=1 Tax=Acinetobacter seifertii TaxID=1530123 RepID=UPI003F51B09A